VKKHLLISFALINICSIGLLGQEYRIQKGSVFHKLTDTKKLTIVESYLFTDTYILTDSDIYERFDDHLKFVPGESSLIKGIPIVPISTDTININMKSDFRTEEMYSNEKRIWYSLDPDLKLEEKATRIQRKRDSRWELNTVTVSAKNRSAVGDSITSTWEMKFSPGFAYTKQFVAWDRIKTPKKVLTSGLDFGLVASLSTIAINKETSTDYKYSRNALTITTGALLNLSIGMYDFGLYGGFDWPIGDGATDWVYFGVPNWGFFFGVDLIKPKS